MINIKYKDVSELLSKCLLNKIKANKLKTIMPFSYKNIEEGEASFNSFNFFHIDKRRYL